MKALSRHIAVLGIAALWTLAAPALAQNLPIHYSVTFNDWVMATQTVTISQADGLTTITSAFEADLPVFIAMHHYAEELSATFRPDGTVVQCYARRQDGATRIEVSGQPATEGRLALVRTDRTGTTTNLVAREDYDFHSLILYGNAPESFLPEHHPARVLDIAEGRVVLVEIQSIAESQTTPERQYVESTHLVWKDGTHTSHSWHPERYSHLPIRYVRETENGRFVFDLQR